MEKEAMNLHKKYETRFTYRPFDITMSSDEFTEAYGSFQRNRHWAEHKYGK
jgi:hypothetical protein